jgi:hypothetical protein
MNAIVAKAMEAIAKLPATEQEAIAREVLARIEANQKRIATDVRAWLDDVQSHFVNIEIQARQQPPMPPSRVTFDG